MPRGQYDRSKVKRKYTKKHKVVSGRAIILEASKIVSAMQKIYGVEGAGAAKLLLQKLQNYYRDKSR